MCENCGINHDTNELENQDAFNAFLDRLFGDIEPEAPTDFMEEYRTEPDVLTDSMVVDAVSPKSTQQVANEFAGHLFGYEY